MAKYTKLAADAFKKLSVNAGVLLRNFDPEDGTVVDSDIFGATNGGSTFQATPEFRDRGEGVDNAPKNTKELRELVGWDVSLNTSFVSCDKNLTKDMNAAADAVGNKIVPRSYLKQEDFLDDFWLVCDYSEDNSEETGGFYAIHMMNVLSTGGFQMKTNNSGNNEFSGVFTAHPTMANQTVVPFEIYIQDGAHTA